MVLILLRWAVYDIPVTLVTKVNDVIHHYFVLETLVSTPDLEKIVSTVVLA